MINSVARWWLYILCFHTPLNFWTTLVLFKRTPGFWTSTLASGLENFFGISLTGIMWHSSLLLELLARPIASQRTSFTRTSKLYIFVDVLYLCFADCLSADHGEQQGYTLFSACLRQRTSPCASSREVGKGTGYLKEAF